MYAYSIYVRFSRIFRTESTYKENGKWYHVVWSRIKHYLGNVMFL